MPGAERFMRRMMTRGIDAAEARLIDRLSTAVAAAGMQVFAHIRVETGGRKRDLFLGAGTRVTSSLSVIDWERAPLAEVFFTGQLGEPYEVEASSDEERLLTGTLLERHLLATDEGGLWEIVSEETRLERRAGAWVAPPHEQVRLLQRDEAQRMRPVSPVQVELDATQKHAVGLPEDRSVLIVGEAGFGKTTVALHRLARLRGAAAMRGEPFFGLVLVPTEGLRRLAAMLLDRLGIEDVPVLTFDRWAIAEARRLFSIPQEDSRNATAAVVRIKRSPALRRVLPEIAARRKGPAVRADLLHLFGDRALVERVADDTPGAGARAVAEVLEHTHLQFSKRSEEVYAHVDADRLKTVDGLAIDEGTPLEDAKTVDVEDAPVLFEINRLRSGKDATKAGRLRRYDHILVDEAQELAPLELALVGRAIRPTGTITLAGDEHQQTDDTAQFPGWEAATAEIGRHLEVAKLEESYRCPPEVTAFARGLFDSVEQLEGPGLIRARFPDPCRRAAVLTDAVQRLLREDRRATIVIICRSAEGATRLERTLSRGLPTHLALDGAFTFEPGLTVTCVREVKGLEFDYVIVPDACARNYPEDDASRRALYLTVTRPLHQLWLCCVGRWSPLIERSGEDHLRMAPCALPSR